MFVLLKVYEDQAKYKLKKYAGEGLWYSTCIRLKIYMILDLGRLRDLGE